MRATRRPLTARPDSRISQVAATSNTITRSSPISKTKKLQKALNSLATYIHRFELVDLTIFETGTSLNSFICDFLAFSQTRTNKSDVSVYQNRWATIKIQLSNSIITINNSQISQKIEEEFNRFSALVSQVDSNPPSSQKLARDSKMMYKNINSAILAARDSLNKKQFDKLKAQSQNLRSDISHQYEAFFRLSQIDKEWKATIVEDCRRMLDKVISFCDIGKEMGLTNFPFVDEISTLIDGLGNETSPSNENKSLIPRHSPMKGDLRRLRNPSDAQTPTKEAASSRIHRIPTSARSKSEQSSKVSRIPKPKDISPEKSSRRVNYDNDSNSVDASNASSITSTEEVLGNTKLNNKANNKKAFTLNPSTKGNLKSTRSASISSKSTKIIEDSNSNRKKEIIPLQESPKITRKSNTKTLNSSANTNHKINNNNDNNTNILSSSQKLSKSIKSDSDISDTPSEKPKKAEEIILDELKQFEQRFTKYVATVGASDLLGRFTSELRATQNTVENDVSKLQQHVLRLQNLITQIEEKIDNSKPLFEIEQRLDQALNHMNRLSSSIESAVAAHADHAEANALAKQFESIHGQLKRIMIDREQNAENHLTRQLQQEIEKFQKAESTFKAAQETNALVKKLRKENSDLKKEKEELNRAINNKVKESSLSSNENYQKIVLEMRAVYQRLAAIQIERKENPDEVEEIDAEIEALLDQQGGLIEQISSF
ncbi:hypothetical protein TRFO_08275 [Tritrichomonas foetus]|uniref:Uncharacterized protein n=1 Tax=Tritrichomonas foetus TaxID=1144522 RepID=A0A1J4JQX7_9EUKA|nr:hypothetical protein TRFO_08275 [Tritrichomonas foetus]|eukprot:OHS99652.1 hypothetical protein TRFO_08275 [Tritrichomonas foetus]